MKKIYNFNYGPKTKPFPHQVEAIRYIENREYVALFDEQGLGKTKIVIEALCNNMANGIIDGAVIICKKQLIENWKNEIETHSFLKYIVLRGSTNEKGLKFMGYSNFYIINYESTFGEVERLKMFLKTRRMAIVLDESHAIKNPNSKTAKTIFELKNHSKKRIIISGTPIANKPVDLWSQFYFLDNGELLGNNFKEFNRKYSVKLKGDMQLLEENKFNKLRELILSNSIRRKKSEVLELPEKIYVDKYIELQGVQKSLYEKLKRELYLEVINLKGEKIIDESEELLKKLLRLAQIASNPFLIDKSYNENPVKFSVLDDLIQQIIYNKEKVIVWSCFVDNIRILYKKYREFGCLMLYGDIPIEKRNDVVNKFRSNNDFKILVANPAAAREGLTLTSANNAIYLDRNFNLVDYLQSQDRIHRITQTKECKIFKLIAVGTIDEYIDEIIYKKGELAGYLQGDSSSISLEKEYLTRERVLNILG